MSGKKQVYKELINSRLLKNYGSWMYCDECNNTIGYLCYTTYMYFKFDFTCNCGSKGRLVLGEKLNNDLNTDVDNLIIKKNRLCCSADESPLFSIVTKNLINYEFEIVCKKCNRVYNG